LVLRVKRKSPAAIQIQPFAALEIRARMLGKGNAIARRLCGEGAGEDR
jgi:hypothetical protein